MKYLGYGAERILVGDAVASAVLHYAAILGETGGGDVVDVPTSDDDGVLAYASIVLGPGISIMSSSAPSDAMEHEDRDFVGDITGRVALVMAGKPNRTGGH